MKSIMFIVMLLAVLIQSTAQASVVGDRGRPGFLIKMLPDGSKMVLTQKSCEWGWPGAQDMYIEIKKGKRLDFKPGCYRMFGDEVIIQGPAAGGPGRKRIENVNEFRYVDY